MQLETRYSVGSRIGKRYLIHQVLLGGMGEVYLCLDTEKSLPFALKTFQRRFMNNIRIREAFKEEIRTWVALGKHPHIVRCHMMEVLDGQPFTVLDWIAGEEGRGTDLRGWLHSGPLSVKLALEIAMDICRGLVHAGITQAGIVHRDLKPENILMAQGPVAKITDWGLARVVQQVGIDMQSTDYQAGIRHSLWGKEGIAGTPAYMAPEQWRGELVDVRTDIYALGCTLYEMLTGNQPYQATTTTGYRRQHLEAPVPVLVLQDQASAELDSVVARCLLKTPDQRYQTVGEVLQSLEAIYGWRFSAEWRVLDNREEMMARDLINRGSTYSLLNDYEKALTDLDRAIQMDSSIVEAYINRGIVYTSLSRYTEALADLDHVQELDPTIPHIYINRAPVLEALGRTDEALLNIERAIELDLTYPQPYINRGGIYTRLKQYDKALEDFNQALQLDPHDSRTFTSRGVLWKAMGEYDKALADFSQAITLDPTDGYAYSNRGRLFGIMHQYAEAIRDFNYAIQFDLDPLEGYLFRGELQESQGEYQEALASYAQFIELSPILEADPSLHLEIAYLRRAILFTKLNLYEKALTEYDHLIKLKPVDVTFIQSRGDAYRELGRYEEASADFASALEIDPYEAGTYNKRGIVFYETGEYDRALEDYRLSIGLDPQLAEPYFNIGLILWKRQQLEEALEYFEKSATLGYERGIEYAAQIRQQLRNKDDKQQN